MAVIHKIELYLRQREGDSFVWNKSNEFVDVSLDAVLEQADRVIKTWLDNGFTEDDYLALCFSGQSYRYVPAEICSIIAQVSSRPGDIVLSDSAVISWTSSADNYNFRPGVPAIPFAHRASATTCPTLGRSDRRSLCTD